MGTISNSNGTATSGVSGFLSSISSETLLIISGCVFVFFLILLGCLLLRLANNSNTSKAPRTPKEQKPSRQTPAKQKPAKVAGKRAQKKYEPEMTSSWTQSAAFAKPQEYDADNSIETDVFAVENYQSFHVQAEPEPVVAESIAVHSAPVQPADTVSEHAASVTSSPVEAPTIVSEPASIRNLFNIPTPAEAPVQPDPLPSASSAAAESIPSPMMADPVQPIQAAPPQETVAPVEPQKAPYEEPVEAPEVVPHEPSIMPPAQPVREPHPDMSRFTPTEPAAAPAAPGVSEETQRIMDMSAAIDVMAGNRRRAQDVSKKKNSGKRAKKKTSAKKEARALKKKAQKLKVPKTAQDTIPYYAVYEQDGVIETTPGVYTKSYLLSDVNYKIAKREEQEEMFMHYGEMINSFDPHSRFQITINQRNMDMGNFERQTMLPMEGDGLDHLRNEQNIRLKKKIRESNKNMEKEKYLTVSIPAPDLASAHNVFARLDTEISVNIGKIGRATATPISSAHRLEILHDIYNSGYEGCFGNNPVRMPDGSIIFDPEEKFRFDIMRKMGLTTKDMIAPDLFKFNSDYGMLGDKYFRALYVKKLPSFLTDDILEKLTDTECNMLTSLQFEPIDGERALKLARGQITRINASVIDKQKQASKAGYSTDLISPDLMDASNEASQLLGDLTGKNQKLFYMTLIIVHFADTKEQLDEDTKNIQGIGRTAVVDIRKLLGQQELGLNSALPLAYNQLEIHRSLTTESASVFMPFTNQELNDRKGGQFYGNNAISHNLIMFNRRNLKNGNGFIFGSPGSGKSMAAKQEMMTVLLSSKDDVIVIDPEGEYYPMAEMLGGEVIRITAGGNVHINPFDMEMNYNSDDDPLSIQSDFIISLCETIAADRFGLSPQQKSAIDRCVRKCYEDYLSSRDPETGEYDKERLPTLYDFWQLLSAQPGYEAQQLAEALEIYVTGSLNLFAHRTNVEYTKRFVVYDIKEIGSNMKAMALLVVLNNVWNRIVAGRAEGKNVWPFIDEIYLLFKNESSAEFLRNMYKRARKYGGIPTGITQNVSDILESDIARTMISNSEYLLLLNQGPMDRAQLGALINMSPTEMEYVSNVSPGHGILYNGVVKVPFENTLDKDTMMYSAMTTKLDEVKAREEKDLLKKAIAQAKENIADKPSDSSSTSTESA